MTGFNQLQPVFKQSSKMFKMRQPATGMTPNMGNLNSKKRPDQGLVQFGPMVIFSPMDWTLKH